MEPKDTAPEDALAGLDTREALIVVTRLLGEGGVENPARDARLLLLSALAITGTDLLRDPGRRLDQEEARKFWDLAQRRAAREPVSRILGERGFYGRTFHVMPATLDPRPCTETVVEAALEIAGREGWRDRPMRILDIGTGTGALLVTLLAELPLATGLGTDISDDALGAAQANAERLGVASRAAFLNRRSGEGVAGPFDLVVSNPPYIPSGDIAALEPEVRDFDPLGALDGGADGLAIYREIAASLLELVPRGWALMEVGAGQASDVAAILREGVGAAAVKIETWTDLGQHTRCVAVQTQR
ncbi:peptide chain release factor N(5)-glutamine methyltransferase [Hyphomicrobium sp.]|uniref:peptide chain release factor N(5)-glutamine methyltransferase n=1 Tax=Hyphomicrobium sp. TaxID=82 RepID=UPI002E36DC6C|nr:peptide chain release factor N(5)-glutamine methyltransferase [Hyphomicrobium sp.]HEX2841513.1 peptide chain release factor N(5)-glutamine methyltransferase [Hyphomicrobium sp.]